MSEVVRQYYNRRPESEWKRLQSPYGSLEWAGTLHLIDSYFPASGHVADIGGGPGRYTIELLQRGFQATLVDLSEHNIALAEEKLSEAKVRAEAVLCANATDLSCFESSSFDAALMLGPMYHIIDENVRRQALEELGRILKPGAPAIVGFINPLGVLRAALTDTPEMFSEYVSPSSLLDTCIQCGEQEAFTEAAFLAPAQAVFELRQAGFAVETRAGAEGFAAGMLDEVQAIAAGDPGALDTIRRLVAETCELPAYRDSTEHLQVVVRRIA